jgi:hypothetical protein
MATVTKKIDTLPAMELTVANNDKLVMLDVDQSAVDMTKLMTMSQIPISLPAQLAESVVENAAIANDAVRTSKIKDANVTLAKIEKSLNAYVLGNKASHATTPDGVVEISPSAANQVLLGSTGTTNTVDFGKVTVNHIGNISARTVIGNATNASAAPTAIAANTDGYVLRRSGDTIGFGKVKAAGIDSMTSAQLKAIVSDETGSGALVFGTSPTIETATLTSPTLVTPALGTPSSGVLTNCTIKRTVLVPLFGWDDLVVSRTFTNVMRWAFTLNGHTVTNVRAAVATPGSATGAITVEVKNNDTSMKTLSIGSGAVASSTYSVTSVNSVVTDNPVTVVVTYGGTTAKGLTLYLEVTG